jgi:hypothetical protein
MLNSRLEICKAVRTKGVEVVMLEVAASELEIEAHVGC